MNLRLLTAIVLTGFAGSAPAQTVITADPAETLKTIVVGDGKTALTASLGIAIRSSAATKLAFQSYGLTSPDKTALGPASLTGPVTADYVKDAFVPVTVNANNLVKLGEYTGKFEFRELGTSPGGGKLVNVSITVKGKPALTIPPQGLSGYRCYPEAMCGLANYLSPISNNITMNNKDGSADAEISKGAIYLRASSADPLSEVTLGANFPKNVSQGSPSPIPIHIPGDKVVAGRYDGFVRVDSPTGDFVATPITLDVRDSPLIAILLLAAGIVVGRLIQAANSPAAVARQKLLTSLGTLRGSSASVRNPQVQLLLEKKLADARQAIVAMNQSETVLTQNLQDIGTVIAIETNLEWMEANLGGLSSTDNDAVRADIATSRTALLGEQLTDAETARKKAQGDLLGHLIGIGFLPPAVDPKSLAFDALPPAIAQPQPRVHIRAAAFLAGIPIHKQSGKYPFVQALMFITLLVGLVIVGLYTLYIKNATFGSSALFDYFGIAAWGLSADVAQRTLQGIQSPK